MSITTIATVIKRIRMDTSKELDRILCSLPITVLINQGNPKPMRMSKMLEPMELLTAMSPWPFFRATLTEAIVSGMEVPAANKVRPITGDGILKVSPNTVAHQTMQKDIAAIHTIDIKNVMKYHFLNLSLRTSGMLSHIRTASGKVSNHHTFPPQLSGISKGLAGSSSSSSPSSSPLLSPFSCSSSCFFFSSSAFSFSCLVTIKDSISASCSCLLPVVVFICGIFEASPPSAACFAVAGPFVLLTSPGTRDPTLLMTSLAGKIRRRQRAVRKARKILSKRRPRAPDTLLVLWLPLLLLSACKVNSTKISPTRMPSNVLVGSLQ
mmetsp:Transcript_35577/g.69803  ORF Transcript_35577/g.69803 Transcript_35577/m.69803 type:complete len:323 (-) Transcript_35577:1187-2155(-)